MWLSSLLFRHTCAACLLQVRLPPGRRAQGLHSPRIPFALHNVKLPAKPKQQHFIVTKTNDSQSHIIANLLNFVQRTGTRTCGTRPPRPPN